MKCQSCANPATVHITTIDKSGQKKLVHLRQACAEQQQLVKQQELNLPAILQTLIGQHLGPADQLARLACPACGIKYMEFRAQGRLGCPHDYAVFRPGLEPLLRRIHRAGRHTGKSPRRTGPSPDRYAELVDLRRQLQAAIDSEAFEEAARLRDLIREREATDESG